MRRMRPETSAIVRQMRTAMLWAFAFSSGAIVCVLALPLLLIHALTAIATASPHAVLPHVAFAGALLILRGALLTARNRVLTRTSLWASHALGVDALGHGLDGVRAPNDLAADRDRLIESTVALAAIAPVFDAILVVVPLGLLLALHPLAGLVTAMTLVAASLVIAFAARRLQREDQTVTARRDDADANWRTACANSVALGARGLTARAVGDWQSLNGRAIAAAYRSAQGVEQVDAVLRHLASISTAGLLVGLAFAESTTPVSIGLIATAFAMHVACLATVCAAWERLPMVLAAYRQFQRLSGAQGSSALESTAAPSGTATKRPSPDHRYAEAS